MVEFALHNLRWDAFWKRIAGQAGRYPSDVPETRYTLDRITVYLIWYRYHATILRRHVFGVYLVGPVVPGPVRPHQRIVHWPRLLPR